MSSSNKASAMSKDTALNGLLLERGISFDDSLNPDLDNFSSSQANEDGQFQFLKNP